MQIALEQARMGESAGEVPIGAVIVKDGAVIAATHNAPRTLHDPTAHAEILALRMAGRRLRNYRLAHCELFVTLEPCAMCAQALLHARLSRVVFAAAEPRTGAAGSWVDLFADWPLFKGTRVEGGLMAEPARALMQGFFRERRAQERRRAEPLRPDALRAPVAAFEPLWQRWPQWQPCQHSRQDLPALEGLRLSWMALPAAHSASAQTLDRPAPTIGWLALHGPRAWWPQWATWAESRCARGEAVWIPDLIGHGMSDQPKRSDWHQCSTHLAVLRQWLDTLPPGPMGLVWHPDMQGLAERLCQQSGREMRPCPEAWSMASDPGLPGWMQWPYPDAGHRAAWQIDWASA